MIVTACLETKLQIETSDMFCNRLVMLLRFRVSSACETYSHPGQSCLAACRVVPADEMFTAAWHLEDVAKSQV